MVKCPAGLGPTGRKLWREMVARMAENDAEPDVRERKILLSACELADDAAIIRAAMVGAPTFTEGSRGQIVMHPGHQELRMIAKEIASLMFRIDLEPFDESGGFNLVLTPAMKSNNARAAANRRWKA